MSKGKFAVPIPIQVADTQGQHRSISPVPAAEHQSHNHHNHTAITLEVENNNNNGSSPLMSSRQKTKKSFRHQSSVLNDHFLPAAGAVAQRQKSADVMLPNVSVWGADVELVVRLLRLLDGGLRGTVTTGANPSGPLLEGPLVVDADSSSGISWAPLYEAQYAVQGWSLAVDAIVMWWNSKHAETAQASSILIPAGVTDLLGAVASLLLRVYLAPVAAEGQQRDVHDEYNTAPGSVVEFFHWLTETNEPACRSVSTSQFGGVVLPSSTPSPSDVASTVHNVAHDLCPSRSLLDYFLTLWIDFTAVSQQPSATASRVPPLRLLMEWLGETVVVDTSFLQLLPSLYGTSTLRMSGLVWESLCRVDSKLRIALRSAAGQVDGIGVVQFVTSLMSVSVAGGRFPPSVDEPLLVTLLRGRHKQPLDSFLDLTESAAAVSAHLRESIVQLLQARSTKTTQRALASLLPIAMEARALTEIADVAHRQHVVRSLRHILALLVLSSQSGATALMALVNAEQHHSTTAEEDSQLLSNSANNDDGASRSHKDGGPMMGCAQLFAAQLCVTGTPLYIPAAIYNDALVQKVAAIVRAVFEKIAPLRLGSSPILDYALQDTLPTYEQVKVVKGQVQSSTKTLTRLRSRNPFPRENASPSDWKGGAHHHHHLSNVMGRRQHSQRLPTNKSVSQSKLRSGASWNSDAKQSGRQRKQSSNSPSPLNRSPGKSREGSPLSRKIGEGEEDPFATTIDATSESTTIVAPSDGWRQHGGTVFLQRMERALELREPEQLRRRVQEEETQRIKRDDERAHHSRDVAERCRHTRRDATRATHNRAKQSREDAAQREKALNDESVDQVQIIIQSSAFLTPRTKEILERAKKERKKAMKESKEKEAAKKERPPPARPSSAQQQSTSRDPKHNHESNETRPSTSMGNARSSNEDNTKKKVPTRKLAPVKREQSAVPSSDEKQKAPPPPPAKVKKVSPPPKNEPAPVKQSTPPATAAGTAKPVAARKRAPAQVVLRTDSSQQQRRPTDTATKGSVTALKRDSSVGSTASRSTVRSSSVSSMSSAERSRSNSRSSSNMSRSSTSSSSADSRAASKQQQPASSAPVVKGAVSPASSAAYTASFDSRSEGSVKATPSEGQLGRLESYVGHIMTDALETSHQQQALDAQAGHPPAATSVSSRGTHSSPSSSPSKSSRSRSPSPTEKNEQQHSTAPVTDEAILSPESGARPSDIAPSQPPAVTDQTEDHKSSKSYSSSKSSSRSSSASRASHEEL